MSPTTSQDQRCPQCSALTSPGADWCTLCFADLRPPPPVEAAPEPAPAVEPGSGSEEPVDASDGPGSGKHASRTSYDESLSPSGGLPRDAASVAEAAARADEMLAQLAADTTHPLGPIASRLDSTRAQAIAASFGCVLLVVIALLVMTVLGHFI